MKRLTIILARTAFLLVGFLGLAHPGQALGAPKTVVLLPLTVYADQSKSYVGQGVKSMLLSRLSGGDIEVLLDDEYIHLLRETDKQGMIDPERAEEMARRLQADCAVFGSITAIGDSYSVDLSLLEVQGGTANLTRLSRAVKEDQFIPQLSDIAHQLRAVIQGKKIPTPKSAERPPLLPEPETSKGMFSKIEPERPKLAPLEEGLSFKPTREYQGTLSPTGKISVDMQVMDLALADLDNTPGAEVLVLSRKELRLYARQGASFALRDTFEAGYGENFLKVSVGDVDADGTPEIYLVALYGERARSMVLEWVDKPIRLSRHTGHLRAIKDGVEGKALLLYQNSKLNEFFSGPIEIVTIDKKGKLTTGQELPELKGVEFYTLTLFDLERDGSPEWLGLGANSRFYVWDEQGEAHWVSEEKLSGTNNEIRLGTGRRPDDLLPWIALDSEPLISDIDGDGNEEVLVIENIPMIKHLVQFKVYNKANVIAYRIEGTQLIPAWSTATIDYCLTGIKAEGRALFLAAHKAKISNIGRGSGLIMWFE
jgi:hypothetical protein